MAIPRFLLIALLLAACSDVNAGPSGSVVEAHVVQVIEQGQRDVPGAAPQPFERLEVELDSSLYRGERHTVEWNGRRGLGPTGFLREGDRVLLAVSREGAARSYTVAEVVRLPQLAPLGGLLAVALLVIARLAGLAAVAGLAGSAGVLLLSVVPAVQRGEDPLVATVLGSAAALVVLVLTAGGLRRQSVAALVGSLAGLAAVVGLGAGALVLARVSGYTSDDAVLLTVAGAGKIDLARVVLASATIASLGALSALSVGQASRTLEIAVADPDLRGRDLYLPALRSGSATIGSLANTLGLAYFAVAFPVVLLMSFGYQPLSVTLNSEEITASILTLLIVSTGLVLSSPVTTAAAVLLAGRRRG